MELIHVKIREEKKKMEGSVSRAISMKHCIPSPEVMALRFVFRLPTACQQAARPPNNPHLFFTLFI